MPKISVIIPVYNVEPYLKRCLDSVINQTLTDIEIICINDCSTDGSLLIVNEYANKDNRIKLIDLPKNIGAGGAKNKGLEVAQGEYLSFIDPDDEIDLDFFEKLYIKAKETNADIVKGELITLDVDGTKTKSSLNEKIKQNQSIYYFTFDYTTAIYKSAIILNNKIIFPEDLIVGEDVIFLNKAILKANKLEIINSTNYYYIRRKDSLNIDVFDAKRMLSAIKIVEYTAMNYNDALINNDITEQNYLKCYYGNMITIMQYTIQKTKNNELKIECVKKFVELFDKCLLMQDLENYINSTTPELLSLLKEKNIQKLFEICLKYKTLYNYHIVCGLKNNIKKDLEHA